jgi:hypothetical protein
LHVLNPEWSYFTHQQSLSSFPHSLLFFLHFLLFFKQMFYYEIILDSHISCQKHHRLCGYLCPVILPGDISQNQSLKTKARALTLVNTNPRSLFAFCKCGMALFIYFWCLDLWDFIPSMDSCICYHNQAGNWNSLVSYH